MRTLSIGLLAEGETDCKALGVLVRRVASDAAAATLRIKSYWGHGCAKLRRKAAPKLKSMYRDGCSAAILVHDLDRNPENGQLNDENALRAQLEKIDVPLGLMRWICIPIEELEAWFWSDPAIIHEIGQGNGKAHPSPHLIQKPKEKLIKLSIGANRKPRYSTNDNEQLASKLDLELCAQRCNAFRDLRNFISSIVGHDI